MVGNLIDIYTGLPQDQIGFSGKISQLVLVNYPLQLEIFAKLIAAL